MNRFYAIVALLVVIALAFTGCAGPSGEAGGNTAASTGGEALECTDEIGCVEIAPDEPIRVGYLLTISGATAFLGEDSMGGIEIAMEERGNVLGHELELVGEDSLCNSEGGQTAATKLTADDSVVGIVGTTCSGSAAAALPIVSEAGMFMVSPSNTDPRLTDPDTQAGGLWMPGYFRTAHNDIFQGRIAAEFLYNELGKRKLATIHDGSTYADSLQRVAAEVFTELGGEVVYQGAVNVGDTDMRPILTEVASAGPDALYFPIFEPEGDLITAQSVEISGLEDVSLMGADGLFVDSFPENTGPASVGMYLSSTLVRGEAYNEFLQKWQDKFGGPPPSAYHAMAYDATNLILNAVEAAAQVGDDGTILVGRQALRDAMTATSDYKGLTGTLSCSETGDCATGEALGVYVLSEAELEGNWPPQVVWPHD
ncbi:MAG: branched-chain amino acid ABC transporter substrate-binding protein [Caldilineaceae bacterium]